MSRDAYWGHVFVLKREIADLSEYGSDKPCHNCFRQNKEGDIDCTK